MQTYAKLEKVNDDTNWYLIINSVLQYMPYHLAAKIKSPFQECHDVIIIAFSFCIRLLEWKLRLTTEIKKKFLFYLIRDVSYNFPSALITIGLKKYKVKVFLRATTSSKKNNWTLFCIYKFLKEAWLFRIILQLVWNWLS